MQLAWGEGHTGLEGAGNISLGCSSTQHRARSGVWFNYLAVFLAGKECIFHSSLARKIPVRPPLCAGE